MRKKLSILTVCMMMCAGALLSGCSSVPEGYIKEGSVDNGAMFGNEGNNNIYNYCPSMFYEDENTMHAYYCSNRDSGNITDYVAYRKGVKVGGEWYWSEKSLVLSPTQDTWDERHTCDPSVIKGSFSMGGESYSYLMAYLGCITNNSMRNEVGIAVAKTPEGPWVKCSNINPIAKYPEEYTQWGYGQPSLVSADKAGEVFLFYTAGLPTKTCQMVERWNLSDLDAPQKIFSEELTNRGLYFINSTTPSFISNADFAYSPNENRFYMVFDGRPFETDHEPSFLSSASRIAYLEGPTSATQAGGFSSSDLRWKYLFQIDYTISGYYRNHNCCIIRDAYGWTDASESMEVAYTISELDKPMNSLWTYRIYRYRYEV